MTFFTYDYLKNQGPTHQVLWLSLTIALLVIMALVLLFRFRIKKANKYRDIVIVFMLGLLFMIGVQYQNMNNVSQEASQKSKTMQTMQNFAKDNNISVKDLAINSTTWSQQMIIKEKNRYYRIDSASDGISYVTNRVNLTIPKKNIIVK
jgi:4-amino-4-deoxy-L-arabinose transferase-like glycosyltransferase